MEFGCIFSTYCVSANNCRNSYSLLNLQIEENFKQLLHYLEIHLHKTFFSCHNYSREETICGNMVHNKQACCYLFSIILKNSCQTKLNFQPLTHCLAPQDRVDIFTFGKILYYNQKGKKFLPFCEYSITVERIVATFPRYLYLSSVQQL